MDSLEFQRKVRFARLEAFAKVCRFTGLAAYCFLAACVGGLIYLFKGHEVLGREVISLCVIIIYLAGWFLVFLQGHMYDRLNSGRALYLREFREHLVGDQLSAARLNEIISQLEKRAQLGSPVERLGELVGFLLPRRIRKQAFEPFFEEMKADRLEAASSARSFAAKAWVEFCFHFRLLVTFVQSLLCWFGDILSKMSPVFKWLLGGGGS